MPVGARALLAWDGTAYGGWQLQPNVPTVQGAVEGAVSQLMNRARVVVRAAGRLDAGVHSQGQVVGFAVEAPRTIRALYRGLNGLLPDDIVCLAMSAAPADYDPRRHNCGKVYRYRCLVRTARCPLRRMTCWHVGRELDVRAMQQAAQALVGSHDFSTFRASGCSARHAVRRIRSIDVVRHADEVHILVDGEAFLRHQVRIMAGCLVEVGQGRATPDWVSTILMAADRTLAARTAPAHGLSLERVLFRPALAWEEGATPEVSWAHLAVGGAREAVDR